MVLAQAVIEELRRRGIVLPPVPTIERLSGEIAKRAQRKVSSLLAEDLSVEQRGQLDELLELRPGSFDSTLSRLRLPAGAPIAKDVLAHIERPRAIHEHGLSPEIKQRVHQNRLLELAREGAQSAVYQFKEYEQDRRHGTLAALMVETTATLTDEILELHDRVIGSLFTQAKNKYERVFAEQSKKINDKVRLYARIGFALVEAGSKAAMLSKPSRKSSLGRSFRTAYERPGSLRERRASTRLRSSPSTILCCGDTTRRFWKRSSSIRRLLPGA